MTAQVPNNQHLFSEYHINLVHQEILSRLTVGGYDNDYQIIVTNTSGAPSASVDVSRRTIFISASFYMLNIYFADIAHIQLLEKKNFFGCFTQYTDYISMTLSVMAQNGYPAAFLAPEEFGRFGNDCTELDEFLPLERINREARDRTVSNALAFTILHEIGHVAKGHHVTHIPPENSFEAMMQYYCNSRSDETAADQFAIERLYEFGWGDAVLYTPLFNVLHATSGFRVEDGSVLLMNHSSHPFPMRRASIALTKMRDLNISDGREINPEINSMIQDVNEGISRIFETIDSVWADYPLAIPMPAACE